MSGARGKEEAMEEEFDLDLSGSGADGSVRVNSRVHVSAADLSRLLGVETADIARLARQGVVEKSERRGDYVLEPSVRGFVDYLRAKASAKPRDRLDTIKAERERAELEQLLGTLVLRDDAARCFSDAVTTARRYLEGVGARLAPVLSEKTNAHEIHELIDDEIRTALESLAASVGTDGAGDPARAGSPGECGEPPPGDAAGLPPATPPDGERVG